MKPNLLYIRYYDIHVVPEKMYVYEKGFFTLPKTIKKKI